MTDAEDEKLRWQQFGGQGPTEYVRHLFDIEKQVKTALLQHFEHSALVDVVQDEFVWLPRPFLTEVLSLPGKALVFYNGAAAQAAIATAMRYLGIGAMPITDADELVALFNRDDGETRRLIVRQPSLSHGVSLYANRVVWVGPTGEYGDAVNTVFWQSLARARMRPGGVEYYKIIQYVYPEYK